MLSLTHLTQILKVDDFNHLVFDVANNSKSVQNNYDNILSVDCEVDDILCLLDFKNENDNEDISDESDHIDDD